MDAQTVTMICQCCFSRVRYDSTSEAWFHDVGDPRIETIARAIMPDNGLLTPMRPVMGNDISMIVPFSKPTTPNPNRKIRNIRITNGKV